VTSGRTPQNLRVEILLVVLASLLSLGLRSYPIHDAVFAPDGVRMMGADPFFHMRTVDNLARHFPQRSGFDPYMIYPGGQQVPTGPLFDWILAGAALLLGGGTPDDEWIDFVGAWAPAVIGALLVPLAWLVGRTLFGVVAGLVSAGLIAVLPGNLFELTRLGFPDHHAAEALLYVGVWAALAAALRSGMASGRPFWTAASVAGLLLGGFLANRPAGAFLAAFLVLWAGLDCIARHFRRQSCVEVGALMSVTLLIAAAVFVPVGGMIWSGMTLLVLAGGLAAVAASAGLSWWLTRRNASTWAYPAALAASAAVLVGVAVLLVPETVQGIYGTLRRLASSQTVLTIRELHPLLAGPDGGLTFQPAYEQFTTSFFLLPVVAGSLLLESLGGREDSNKRLFLVLGGCFFAATLAQNRMAIYLAPVAAVGVGWLVEQVWSMDLRRGVRSIVLAGTLGIVYLPNLHALTEQAPALTGITDDWVKALHWLRDNTPEPLGDPNAYFSYEPRRATGDPYPYPPSAYSVMLWWDYGYWLLREGRRMPAANGTQSGAVEAANFFVQDDPAAATRIAEQRASRYIVTDPTLPLWREKDMTSTSAKFRSMLVWSGVDPKEYCEFYVRIREGEPEIVTVFYPKYYRSMMARLHLFDGTAVEPKKSTWVIAYQEREGSSGSYRRISSMRRFDDYPQAQKYIDARPDQKLVLAGLLPQTSCVPLEALEDYELIYRSSDDKLAMLNGYRAVKIFERTGPHHAADNR